jgi:hypothetical protein
MMTTITTINIPLEIASFLDNSRFDQRDLNKNIIRTEYLLETLTDRKMPDMRCA